MGVARGGWALGLGMAAPWTGAGGAGGRGQRRECAAGPEGPPGGQGGGVLEGVGRGRELASWRSALGMAMGLPVDGGPAG